jgi:hypothetical protein
VKLQRVQEITKRDFSPCTFVAQYGGMKQTRGGGWIITLNVPFEYRDTITPLIDAAGLLLDVSVVPWIPTKEGGFNVTDPPS